MIIKPKYYGPQIPSTYAVNMTAAASGSNGITVADDDDIDFGTGDFFLHWEGSLPDWTPAAIAYHVYKIFSNVGYIFSTATDGTLRARVNATNYFSTVPTGIIDGAIAKCTAVITRESASVAGSVVFYVNGNQLGASVAITAASPAASSNSATLAISGTDSLGAVRTASNTISCIVGNFAPTAAEVLDLCTNGIPASWKWGSQAAVYAGNYSAGVDGVTTTTGTTLTGNIDGIDGENDWLRVERTGATGNNYCLLPVAGLVGKRVRTSVKIHNAAGSGVSYFYILYVSSPPSESQQVVVAIPAGTTKTIELDAILSRATTIAVAPADVSGNNVTVATGSIYYVKESFIYKSGATMALLPPSIPTSGATAWDDSSGNTGGGTLPAAGASKVTIRK